MSELLEEGQRFLYSYFRSSTRDRAIMGSPCTYLKSQDFVLISICWDLRGAQSLHSDFLHQPTGRRDGRGGR